MSIDLNIEFKEVESYQRNATVTIPSKSVDTVIRDVFKELATQVRMDGFRRGRVNWQMLEKMPRYRSYGYDEVKRKLLNECYTQLLEDKELDLLSFPKMEEGKLKRGKDFVVSLELEVRPALDLGDLSAHSVNFEKVTLEDVDVDEAVEAKRQSLAELQPVEGRPVEEGDTLRVDLLKVCDGEVEMDQQDVDFDTASGQHPAELLEALFGANVGDTVEKELVHAHDDHEHTDAYKITVNEIQARVAPTLDDEMAKDAGYDDVAAMREALAGELTKAEEKLSETRFNDTMLEKVCEALEVPVPPRLLDEHIDNKISRMFQQFGGLDPQMMASLRSTFRESMLVDATKEVQASLLVEQIIKDQSFEVSEEEVDAELQSVADEQGRSVAYVKSMYGEDGLKGLRSQLQRRQALAWLGEQITKVEDELTRQDRRARIESEDQAARAAAEAEVAEEVAEEATEEAEATEAAAEESSEG
jgi:trigger factor